MALKHYKDKVRKILETKEGARNDDGVLLAYMIRDHAGEFVQKDADGRMCIRLKDLGEITAKVNFESVRRSRQLVQNEDGEFLPTDPGVIKERKIKEKNYRDCEVREAKLF